jgi:streptogramin lyase
VRALAAGPDGAMWFVDQKTRTVGRVELPTK